MAMQQLSDSQRQLQSLLSLLRSTRTPESLMGELMLELSHDLSEALKRFGDYGQHEMAGLMAPLANDLIRALHFPGLRRVEICGASTVLQVRTRECEREGPTETMPLFGGESAVEAWALASGRPRHTDNWQIFSHSQWHIMIVEWLFNHLRVWIEQAGSSRAPGVNAAAIAREVARITTRKVPDYGLLLDVLLLDALGYPRALVAYHLRLGMHGQLPNSVGWERDLIDRWDDTRYWPGRTRKLFPIAVSAAALATGGVLTPTNVRNALVEHGLSRNAWAHLARLPLATLQLLCQVMESCPNSSHKRLFLDEFSFWLSRLGGNFRYYRLPSENLTVALVWSVRESVEIRGRQDEARAARRVSMPLLSDSLYWHESLVSRMELSARHHERLRLLLLVFSREVLAQSAELPALFSQLSAIMDWFRAEGLHLPVSWYKQPWAAIRSRSTHWHDEVVRQQEDQLRVAEQERQVAEQLLILPDFLKNDEGEGRWTAPLPCYQAGDLVLQALLDTQALKEEGRLMRHCVGSYSQACIQQRSLIYAVSRAGERLGTLEMYAASPKEWRVVQFKGRRNLDLMYLVRRNGSLYQHYEAFRQALHRASWEKAL